MREPRKTAKGARTKAVDGQKELPRPSPVAPMLEDVLGCKWSLQLLTLISGGMARPSELLRACPGLSAKVMNERLRKLVRYGILDRRVSGEKAPFRVEYVLTPFGERFAGVISTIRELEELFADERAEPRGC